MVDTLFLFPTSADPARVAAVVTDQLVPLLKSLPGLVSIDTSDNALMGPGGPKPYQRLVRARFETLDQALAPPHTPEGPAVGAAIQELGGQIWVYEVAEL